MTDRISALTVVLVHDIRIDDVQPLIDAIRMLHWVADVAPLVAEPMAEHAAKVRYGMRAEQAAAQAVRDAFSGPA